MNFEKNERAPQKGKSTTSLPNIGITMGDAAGIGPEIVVKAVGDPELKKICTSIIIGDLSCLKRTATSLDSQVEFVDFCENGTKPKKEDAVQVFDLDNLRGKFPQGQESATAGRASAEYIEAAVDLWKNEEIDAITTAPINKMAIALGGYDFPGHTEFLASLTDTDDFAMSFFAGKLCVVLLSTHVSLQEAIGLVRQENLVEIIRFTNDRLSSLLNRKVSIAVAGLNPHASEGGMFGTEESDEIIPAIEECRGNHSIDVSGPYSPDTIFLRGFEGEFDGVVSCYHDQATIAVKCLSFGASVNVTLGLPLIRTSVDHGTAYDIAGKNVADSSSLKAAVRLAADFAQNRKKF